MAGTLVSTPDGATPIGELQIGDLVLARDERAGEYRYDEVANTFVRRGAPIVEVVVVGEEGAAELLETTAEHPFWVEGQGWVRVADLDPGDVFLAENGMCVTLDSVASSERVAIVYNIEVAGSHTYFVGEFGTWVHNKARMFGSNGTRVTSKTVWQGEGRRAPRIDVENPNPG